MAPRSIRIGELIIGTLMPTLGSESLTVREGGQVGSVDGHLPAHVGMRGAQAIQHATDAGVQLVAVDAELRGEAVAGIDARSASECVLQRGMLGDERGGAALRRDRVQRLHQRHADHCADRIARASGPARLLKIGNKPTYLGGL
jgi:hypothetical protein